MAANQCQQNYKMSDKEIKVPNIGEFKDVEVIEVLVSNGQSVSKNDPLITIESDKSSVEIPASFDGKAKSVKIKVGDRVSEGDLILTVEQSGEEEKNKIVEWAIPHDARVICAGLACVDMQLNQATGGDGGEGIEKFEGEKSIGGGRYVP